MNYLMITSAAFLFSLQFLFSSKYKEENGSGWRSSLIFSLYSSIAGLTILLIINKFQIEITAFSVIIACIYSAADLALIYSSIKALEYANLSVYSIFSMIGGMILPFAYGILCGEQFKAVRLICCILIAASVVMSIDRGGQAKKAAGYYISVFILNGMAGVLSKLHQSHATLCVDSTSFIILAKMVSILLSLIFILTLKERSFSISKKAFAYCSSHALCNSIGNLLILIALLHLPASVQYPIVTGGVIVFSTIADIVRKAKVTKKSIAAAALAFISASLMAL